MIMMLVLCAVLFFLLRIFVVLHNRFDKNTTKRMTCKVMAVFGSGGHTSEMAKLMNSLSLSYSPIVYVCAETDHGSVNRIQEIESKREVNVNQEFQLIRMYRSREVGQSWLSSVLSTVRACVHALFIVLKHRPNLILCNGPGTCVPVCGAAFLYKVLFIVDTKIIFVESICRVKSLSLSGLILYRFVDRFLVQWRDLLQYYPNAEYIGRLI